MAECKCGETWLWDWCNDCYVDKNGDPFEEIELADSGLHTGSMIRCTCRRVNAVTVNCDCGGAPLNRNEWKDIDWEQDEHSYD